MFEIIAIPLFLFVALSSAAVIYIESEFTPKAIKIAAAGGAIALAVYGLITIFMGIS